MEYNSDYDIRLSTLGEMGGDTGKTYNSVYDIDLDILHLTEQGGGGGGSAIQDVDTLPDAEANKNKFVRLSTDNKVYVSECSIITEEVNAPDSEQIGVAYLYCSNLEETWYYKGEATITDGTNTYTAYRWGSDEDADANIFTILPASEITSLKDYAYYADCDWESNGENSYIDECGITIAKLSDSGNYSELYVVKQTVTTEIWDWKPLDYQPMISLTYSELKSLRDNKQLVAGQQYRITDYVTTTAQQNTQSVGHPFDIIVTADYVDKLNENARAINHPNTISAIVVLSSDESYFIYERYSAGDDTTNGYAWAMNSTGEGFSTIEEANENGIEWGNIDSTSLIYSDTITPSVGDILDMDGTDVEVVDFSDSVNNDYFANSKLEAWQLKYCLDNDVDRFSWADDNSSFYAAIKVYQEDEVFSVVCRRYVYGDNTNDESGYENYQIAWAPFNTDYENISDITDWDDINPYYLYYTESETPSIDISSAVSSDYTFIVSDYAPAYENPVGKGVIYYMQDEWNNRCYFDFKNIQVDTAASEFRVIEVLQNDSYYGYKRYPEGDSNGQYAWAFNSWIDGHMTSSSEFDITDSSIVWDAEFIDIGDIIYTDTPVPAEGDTCSDDSEVVQSAKLVVSSTPNYAFVFADDEMNDATLYGGSKNNIIEGKYDELRTTILTLDVTFNSAGEYINNYRGELVTINGTTTTLQQFLEGL